MSDRVYSLDEYRKERRTSKHEELLAGQLRQAGITGWEREYRFDTTGRRWRFDFAFPEIKLAVEIEGLTADLTRGGHSTHAALRRDMEKGNAAVAQGWRVLRFEQATVDSGQALGMILTIVESHQ